MITKDSDEISIPRETVAESPHAMNGQNVRIDGQEWRIVSETEDRVVLTDSAKKTRIMTKMLFEQKKG